VQDSSRVPAVWEQARSLGLIGVELGTAVDAARLLSHDDVDDSLRYLADESVPVLVHPNRPGTLGKVSPRLERGLAWPTDTAAVVAARIERARSAPHPRACLSHGGGPLLWEWTRLFGARRDDDVAIPDWMYVDTALCSGAQVEYLIRVLGPDRVLFGSDQPAIDDDVMADHANSMPTSWPGLAGKAPAEAFLGISL
jgi:predicted TIM-barrel fold metal-dependent hydrolase